jgi:hypothetical protein
LRKEGPGLMKNGYSGLWSRKELKRSISSGIGLMKTDNNNDHIPLLGTNFSGHL